MPGCAAVSPRARLLQQLARATVLLAVGVVGMPTALAGPLSCALGPVSGFSLAYSASSPSMLVATGTVALNCTKTGTNIDTRYYELGASSGLNALGSQLRASSGTGFLNYGLYRDASLANAWGETTGNRLAGAVTTASSTLVNVSFWFAVPASHWVSSGTYTDTVTVFLYQGPQPMPATVDSSPTTASFSVTLSVISQCTLSAPPGTLLLSYTSFQSAASTASTNFAVTCTNGLPYTASLDASSGTLLGLTYSLSISPAGTRTGTGVAQGLSIVGTLAPGQSGICSAGSCTASDTRTLTITY